MPLWIGALLAMLGGWLSRLFMSKLGSWIAGAAVFLGIELVATNIALPSIRQQIISPLGSIPGDIAAWMGVLRLDSYVTIILGAYTAGATRRAIMRRRTAP